MPSLARSDRLRQSRELQLALSVLVWLLAAVWVRLELPGHILQALGVVLVVVGRSVYDGLLQVRGAHDARIHEAGPAPAELGLVVVRYLLLLLADELIDGTRETADRLDGVAAVHHLEELVLPYLLLLLVEALLLGH